MYYWSEFLPVNIAVTDNCKINIYPNPATDKITISGNMLTENANIKIYSVSGNLVSEFSYDENEINLSNLQKGIYFISIKAESNIYTKKIIIQK
jgi:hypothetical protein